MYEQRTYTPHDGLMLLLRCQDNNGRSSPQVVCEMYGFAWRVCVLVQYLCVYMPVRANERETEREIWLWVKLAARRFAKIGLETSVVYRFDIRSTFINIDEPTCHPPECHHNQGINLSSVIFAIFS